MESVAFRNAENHEEESDLFTSFEQVLVSQQHSLTTLHYPRHNSDLGWHMHCSQMTKLVHLAIGVEDFGQGLSLSRMAGSLVGPALTSLTLDYGRRLRFVDEDHYYRTRCLNQSDIDHLVDLATQLVRQGSQVRTISLNLEGMVELGMGDYGESFHRNLILWDPDGLPWDLLDQAQEKLDARGINFTLHYREPRGGRQLWRELINETRDIRSYVQSNGMDDLKPGWVRFLVQPMRFRTKLTGLPRS